jgi:hypothetical protein
VEERPSQYRCTLAALPPPARLLNAPWPAAAQGLPGDVPTMARVHRRSATCRPLTAR